MPFRFLCALILFATPATADVWTFATPSGNIECVVGEGFQGSDLECTIFGRSALMPQFPACPVTRGITVTMLNRGGVSVDCTAPGRRATFPLAAARPAVESSTSTPVRSGHPPSFK